MHSCPHEPYTLQAYRREKESSAICMALTPREMPGLGQTPKESCPHHVAFMRWQHVDQALYIFGGVGVAGRLNDLHQFDTRNST